MREQRSALIQKALIAVVTILVCVTTLLAIRHWPREPLSASIPSSTAIFGSRNELLRLTLASDEQYRVWTPLEAISPQLIDALLLHEDRYFHRHLGVNPIAIVRAAWATYFGGVRQGGSTITMQLARELYGLNTRTVGGKCLQMALALGLELRYSKRDILEAHLNLMPYGGNLQGVGAASLVYFGKQADRLSLGEALSLVVIPQSPARRDPSKAEPEGLRAARERLLARWLERYPESASEADLATLPLTYGALDRLPFIAPHFVGLMLGRRSQSERHTINTTLDVPLQRLSEQVVANYVREQTRVGIRNASILLVDSRDMSVRAMVGSADFFSHEIAGQVNGVTAKRSPGSALKPFIYALALDQGLIHPLTLLKDAPVNFGGFSPENFDGRFVGPLSATDALTRSRNLPAVTLASRLAQPSFYQFLQAAGVSKLASESHYGLALALGGGEVTMEEATMFYAMLANRGVLAPLRYQPSDPLRDGPRLLSEEASFVTLDMLASAPRPDGNSWSRHSPLSIAWKTGTSWGFRDAWTVGVVGPFVLAVWVGNFDGSSNPAFVGVQAAAPLFFRVVDALLARDPEVREPARGVPARLVRIEVCAASGDLPNAECPQTASTWYIPGVSPINVSRVHRRVWIDTRTGKQACPPYDQAHTRSEVFEFWPSDIQQLFAQAGMPRRSPPSAADCALSMAVGTSPRIISPIGNVTYTLRAATEERDGLPLVASVDADVRRLHWFVDDAYIGVGRLNQALSWRAERSGRHIVRVVDDRGRADSRAIEVTLLP